MSELDTCTCEDCFDAHSCPFQEDVNDDDSECCSCCPACEAECAMAI